jgi:hypothetical protein
MTDDGIFSPDRSALEKNAMARLAVGQTTLVHAAREHAAVLTLLGKVGCMPELPVRAALARKHAPSGVIARDMMVHKEKVFFGLTAEELLQFDNRRSRAEIDLTAAKWRFREANALAHSFKN